MQIPEFMDYCGNNSVQFDFISTHEYPTDPPGPQVRTFFAEHLQATRDIVGPNMSLYYTEYDDGYNDDTSYSAAFAIYENYMANGIVDALSWWPFSDLFEEAGMYPNPFSNGSLPVDGLMNVYGIPKPSYRAFQLMHWSGDQLLQTTPDLFWSNSPNETVNVFSVLNANNRSISVFLLNWNVKNAPIIENATVTVTLNGLPADESSNSSPAATVYRIDSTHANAYPAWIEMGSPLYLVPKQVQLLDEASSLVPESITLESLSSSSVQFQIDVPAYSVVNVIVNY